MPTKRSSGVAGPRESRRLLALRLLLGSLADFFPLTMLERHAGAGRLRTPRARLLGAGTGAALPAAIVVPNTPATPTPAAIEDTRSMRFRFIASTPIQVCVDICPTHQDGSREIHGNNEVFL